MKKQDVLDAIRRTAKANGGKPLGMLTFLKETGIRRDDWRGKFWVRWSDAVQEAGFAANTLQIAYGVDQLTLKLVEFARELGHIPLRDEINMKAHSTGTFPRASTFDNNLGKKNERVAKMLAFCQDNPGYDDVLLLCEAYGETAIDNEHENQDGTNTGEGWVYLLKSGRFYKIGRTQDLVRRRGQIAIQMPEALDIVHQIRTDDTAGIEAYWHKRFEAKRKEGEWFDLTSEDVRAFKRRKTFM
ncbi:MAG TPA: GIY-YIG nuclease family protein [Candidatus Methylacidiphilales bacterium]|nr:GIY-YIG nuclease family protein [Candidatus Methylacidiphilales bacterium]